MPPEAAATEDTRVWIGRVASGHEGEHAAFIEWLNGPEAQSIFRRRRLTEYLLTEEGGTVTVVFRAPHTGDPRLMIDFLRYPGLWPEYWEFVSAVPSGEPVQASAVKVHWRRDAEPAS